MQFAIMCGRYTLAIPAVTVSNRFNVRIDESYYQATYNAAPGKILPVITQQDPGVVSNFKWGFIPFWAKDPRIGYKMINARCETVLEKGSFKSSLLNKRCLVPADSYYEWVKEGKQKIPWRIMRADGEPFGMAGLWSVWKDAEQRPIYTFTIITTSANPFAAQVHDRMPVIFLPEQEKLWLSEDLKPEDAVSLLQPYPEVGMKKYTVSQEVNSAVNDREDLIVEKVY